MEVLKINDSVLDMTTHGVSPEQRMILDYGNIKATSKLAEPIV